MQARVGRGAVVLVEGRGGWQDPLLERGGLDGRAHRNQGRLRDD
jgi:hypothetical protein